MIESATLGVFILWTSWYIVNLALSHHCLDYYYNILSFVLSMLHLFRFCYAIGATEAIGGSYIYCYHIAAYYTNHLNIHSGKMSHARVGRICTNLCLAAASGGVTQASISGLVQMRYRHTHYNTNELANAVLASLVAVTGCCAFIEPPWAILIGCEATYTTWSITSS